MATAITRLSPKATYVERGYGQVEPNHLSAQVNGKIYAQLPLSKSIAVLENGMFAKYNYVKNEVDLTGEGEWMLVYNTVKLYEDGLGDHDYAMKNNTYGEKTSVVPATTTVVPRLFKTDIGDIFTTNTIIAASLEVGAKLYVGTDGYLTTEANDGMTWVVVKVYTMPDGQKGVKIMRIA